MNPTEVQRIVDSLHRDKNIEKEIVYIAIESALVSAARGYYGEECVIDFTIDRETGRIDGHKDDEELDATETIGRIGAQRAKQVIIQKIREAERDALYDEYIEQVNQMANGVVQRNEGSMATVSLGNVEAILPRSEQIPGESYHPNERVRTVVCEVKKQGSRIKVVLSRTRPSLVQRLFEQEIPEIAEGVIAVRAIAREPGHRSKVAVSSTDQRVDCVGACVGVRGNRIKNIVDELAGERIDIVRWSDDPHTLITNALQPAEVDEVILCQMMGRAIVLVGEDQLSLAIGRRGQNVRLGSKLCGWDIEIMTQDELQSQIDRAVAGFSDLDGVDEDLANALVGEGYLSYDDLSVIEPDALMAMGNLTEEVTDNIVTQAEERAEEAEVAAEVEKRKRRADERAAAATAEAAKPAEEPVAVDDAATKTETSSESSEAEQTPAVEESATEDTAAEATESEAETTTSTEEPSESPAAESSEPSEVAESVEPTEQEIERG